MICQREPLRRARDLPPVRIHPFIDRRTLGRDRCAQSGAGRRSQAADRPSPSDAFSAKSSWPAFLIHRARSGRP